MAATTQPTQVASPGTAKSKEKASGDLWDFGRGTVNSKHVETHGRAPTNEPCSPTVEPLHSPQRPHRKVTFDDRISAYSIPVAKPMRRYAYKGTDDRHLRRELRLVDAGERLHKNEEATLQEAPVDRAAVLADSPADAQRRAIQLQNRVYLAGLPFLPLAPLRRPST